MACWKMDHLNTVIFGIKPPFSSGIFQQAMFDDTRGYVSIHQYSNISYITGYKRDHIFYQWGYNYIYNILELAFCIIQTVFLQMVSYIFYMGLEVLPAAIWGFLTET